jgi:1,2-diacylglycerol 3-alpha-glucosyltransferase
MRIAMFTNDYLPQVGGVARSVQRFAEVYRREGHDVLIVAPAYKNQPADEPDVFRVAAIREVNDTDFSLALPPGLDLIEEMDAFAPEIIHAHHPFLLGNAAARAAARRRLPLVFTHHTRWEFYTHYSPVELEAMSSYIARLATGYAELCDCVIAPSESIEEILRQRGVTAPIEVIPTGVELEEYSRGDGKRFRRARGIDTGATVIGHCGRLAPEKNLDFLARAMAKALADEPRLHALIVGDGPCRKGNREAFAEAGVGDRLWLAGSLGGQELIDAYHAMDLFAFASKTETQGMVLVEALAAGLPVVALDAPGSREVVRDGQNGRLVATEQAAPFAGALRDVADWTHRSGGDLVESVRQSAKPFEMIRCAERMLALYRQIRRTTSGRLEKLDSGEWASAMRALQREWDIWANRLDSAGQALWGSGESADAEV